MEAAYNDGKAPRAPKHHAFGSLRAGHKRPRAMASYKPQNDDAFIDQDIDPPNLESQYRGYRFMRRFVLAAGILAVIFGLIEGAKEVLGAFPSFSSLRDGAAWAKLLTGLGTITEIGLVLVLVALIWRRRKRRTATVPRKSAGGKRAR